MATFIMQLRTVWLALTLTAAGALLVLILMRDKLEIEVTGQRARLSRGASDDVATPYASAGLSRPVNVVLFIGDGMGLPALAATRIHLAGTHGAMAVDRMPVVGLVTTHSRRSIVTDSAAAATAIATGVKTTNGSIGVDEHGSRLSSLMEKAHDHGMATGIIVTGQVTDATPASFYSHVSSRESMFEIAEHLVAADLDLVLGGGAEYFLPRSAGGLRVDGVDLISEARRRGYVIATTRQELSQLSKATGDVIGLFADGLLIGAEGEPTLAEMVEHGLTRLSKDRKGFFLLVEGSQIDDAAHRNDAQYLVREIAAFDAAISKALEFAHASADTLVLVTADHETGGVLIVKPRSGKDDAGFVDLSWNTGFNRGEHTGNPVAMFAYGPGDVAFGGSYDNTAIATKIQTLLQWSDPIGQARMTLRGDRAAGGAND